MLDDARKYSLDGIPSERGAEWAPRRFGTGLETLGAALAAGVAPDEDVHVYANQGRWVVDCPDCGSAQLACRTDHRFLCNECGNIAIGSRWRRTVWPDSRLLARIEAQLEKRPRRANQNWLPGETVAQLKAEHAAADLAARAQVT